MRAGLADYLRLSGSIVTEASSGIAFYKAMRADRFDVAILDVNLPDTSGFELARDAAEDGQMGVVILTARAGRDDRVKGYGVGADLYLTKPVDGEELLLAVRNLTRRARKAGAGPSPAAHAAWRAAREDELRAPHGWLTPVAYLDVPHAPAVLADVPGRWWIDGDAVQHATGAELTTHTVAEGASSVVTRYLPAGREPGEEQEVAVELVRRTGRYALRLRDPQAPTRRAFTGVPAFGYDEEWVLDAPVRWHEDPHETVVGAARPGLVHHVTVVGEVDVERHGRVTTLALTGAPGGAVNLLLSDEAEGVAPWRVVHLGTPARDAATLRLDLNRTVNLPYAFTPHGTCPAPVQGNHLPFAVTAGEQVPR